MHQLAERLAERKECLPVRSDGFGPLLAERRLLVYLPLMAALMDTAGVAADGRIDNWHGA